MTLRVLEPVLTASPPSDAGKSQESVMGCKMKQNSSWRDDRFFEARRKSFQLPRFRARMAHARTCAKR
jgi:hypothetical protein